MSEKLLPLAATGLVLVLSGLAGTSLLVALDAQKKNEAQAKKIEVLNSSLTQAYGKLTELDAGMIAMAKIMRLDGAQLSKVMAQELAEMRGTVAQPKVETVQPLNVKPETQTSGSVAAAEPPKAQQKPETTKAVALPVAAAPTAPAAPASAQAVAAATVTPDASNPFEALVAEVKAEDDAESLSVTQASPMTMQKIDTLLVQRVSANWVKPSGDVTGLRTELLMKMGRDGAMASVEITKSSGNKAFDTSAEVALKNIGRMPEVAQVNQETYEKAYKSRSIVFSPEMLGN